MSDLEGSEGIAAGTADIIDNMTPGAGPGFREYDSRDAGDIDSARDGVDLLFASIGAALCPDGSVLAADRDRLLWNAVEQLRSHVGRLEARLESRLREPTPEQREQRARDNEADGGETDVLLAQGAEDTRQQLDILRRTLDHAMHRYSEVVGRPWLARHGTVVAGASEYGLGNQVDASAWFGARALRDPAPDVMTHVREIMEHADRKRAALRDAAGEEDLLPRLEDLTFPFDAGGREETAAAVSGLFQALELIFPDGTQLQDERKAGAWRTVRLFDAGASRAGEDALRRMTDHPALGPDPDAEAAARFDEGTRESMLRIQQLSRATDAAGAFYCQTTGEEEWKRRDPAMTAPGGPRDGSSLTGRHHAAAKRVAALGHLAPQRLGGPDIVIVGSPDMDMQRDREAVERRLSRLHRRHPQMVLHYGARLRDRGGVDRNRGIDAIVHRWATGRSVPLVPNPPVWDAENNRFDLHSRDDAWIAMHPDLIVDFGGTGNAHRRFVTLAREKGIEFPGEDIGPRSYEAAKACIFRNTQGQWGMFNNLARLPTAVSAADRAYASAEHLFQAARYRDAPEVQTRIAGARSPGEAAKIGNDESNGPDPAWNARRVDAMRWAIRMKREANPELVDAALEKTGDRPIVDCSNEDPFWGARPDGDRLVGRNTLGRLWMELRQQIREGDPRARASAWPDPLTPASADARTAEAKAVQSRAEEVQAETEPQTEPRTLRWAGIGARETPDAVLADMTALARRMADAGHHLASGGARGADAAFAAGTPEGQRTQWLPWEGFNELAGPDCRALSDESMRKCMAVAERLHPTWDKCSPGVRKLHARNVAVLLGPDLDRPVDAVVCWTEGGRTRGGTGMGLLVAREWKIPVINLATGSAQSAWERLQQMQQRPPAARAETATASARANETRTRGPDAGQRKTRRQRQLQTRWRGMLHGLSLNHLARPVLADLHRETARTAAEERLDSLSRDQLLDALDSVEDQAEQLRAELDAGRRGGPHAAETAKHVAALEAAGDRIHAVLAGKNLEALREQEGLETRIAADAQDRVLSVMLSVGKLASEGPLAMEPNLLVGAAAGIFLGEAARVGQQLAEEARIRSGLGLTHTPGSEEETLALASRGPGQDPQQAGEAFAHMLTDVELKERDDQYKALAHRSLLLDAMAGTAQTFAQANRVDMRRQAAAREERLTGHLQGAESAPAVQRRQDELRDAHGQLIDNMFTNLAALCPVDHVSAADPGEGANSDRDRLLARFASLFKEVERKIDEQLARTARTGQNARNIGRLREARVYLGELGRCAEEKLNGYTDRAPLLWTRPTTKTAGEWLIERQRRALHREKAEALAPDGRHVAIVGGRDLHGRHAGRIAELLNRERIANPDTPLVLHCIAQDGAGRYAAEWAASHGVTCVTHRPQRYTPVHLRRRDDLLLGIPPDTVWNFGAEGDHERAAGMLLDRARGQGDGIEIRDMAAELEGPLSNEVVIEPREQVKRDYERIHYAWKKAEALAGDGPLVYREGVEELLPDIARTLASPHLAGHERRFLDSFKGVVESEVRVRDEISRHIDRARDHLAAYGAILEKRGPHQAGTVLNDIDADYRKWDVRAELIVKTIDNWSGTDNAAHREHLDRRRLDLTDLGAELRAIRKAARDPEAEPHRVEVPLETGVHSWDQLFDRRRFTELTLRTLKPEEERNPETVAEFARWARAWPKETRATVKAIATAAAREKEMLHTKRLAAGLPPGLAAGMVHINEEVWAYQGEEIMQRQAERSRGMGMSA
ncbi:MAG: NADAR domain-containing protein [Alphaproteobacteria bacterium]|nr:NADAR domain-containing protein [Alphaproteobacteria bacterium]